MGQSLFKNNNGSTLVMAMIIVGVIALSGLNGFYIWYRHQSSTVIKPNPLSVSVSHIAQADQAGATTRNQLVLGNWGVELPLTADIQDVTYGYVDGNTDNNHLGLSTKALSLLDPECGPSATPPGTISRQSAATHDNNVAKNDPANFPVYDTKVGRYYFTYEPAQAQCSDDQDTNNQQTAAATLFKAAFQGIKAVQ